MSVGYSFEDKIGEGRVSEATGWWLFEVVPQIIAGPGARHRRFWRTAACVGTTSGNDPARAAAPRWPAKVLLHL